MENARYETSDRLTADYSNKKFKLAPDHWFCKVRRNLITEAQTRALHRIEHSAILEGEFVIGVLYNRLL